MVKEQIELSKSFFFDLVCQRVTRPQETDPPKVLDVYLILTCLDKWNLH